MFKKTAVTVALSFALIATGAQAMSHKHARHLAVTGCTQVQEANGQCPSTKHKAPKVSEEQAMQNARDWDAQHGHETTDTNVRLFCNDLPVDATNAQIKNCVK